MFQPNVERWPGSSTAPWSGEPLIHLIAGLCRDVQGDPGRVVLRFDDDVAVTGSELLRAIEHLAGHLAEHIQPADRVILAIENRAEFIVGWLAILAVRGVPVMVNPGMTIHEAAHVMSDSRPRLCLGTTLSGKSLQAASTPEVNITTLLADDAPEPWGFAHLGAPRRIIALSDVKADVDDESSIHYTSGTTGLPKGCVHDHRQFLRYADLVIRLYGVSSDDVLLNPLQFYYGDSLWLWLTAMRMGAGYVSVRRFSVSRFWPTVVQQKCTILLSIGAIPNLLLKAPRTTLDRAHQLRYALQVAVPPAQHQELESRFDFPWYDVYGLAETGMAVGMPPQWAARYVGTGAMGVVLPEVDVVLLDAQGTAIEGPGVGELVTRTPDMMLGYFGRPDETSAVLEDGWMRTGDRVRRDAEGIYYFEGRIKLVIRRGGENIAPEQVEAVLRQVPGVLDAAVVAVPDPLRGEEAKAHILVTSETDFDANLVWRICREHLAGFKVPRYLEMHVQPFPRTPSMRVDKKALIATGTHPTSHVWDWEAESISRP